MKKNVTQSPAGPQYQPAALLIDTMPGATLTARLDTIEKAITRLADCIETRPASTPGKDLVTRQEAATLFGVTLPTINDWTKKKILTAYKIGRRTYYKRHEITAALIQKRGTL